MADDLAPKKDADIPFSGISDASASTEPPASPSTPVDTDTSRKTAPSNKDPKKIPTPNAPTADGSSIPDPNAQQDQGPQEPNHAAQHVKNALGIQYLDPHLEEMLRVAKLRLTSDKAGLLIDMPQNGHSLHCGKRPDGIEFIGMPNKRMIVDEHDAHVMIGLAKGRGWKSVNVNGIPEEQELLWLEAMQQGLHVANFQPDPNSDIVKKFQEWYLNQPKESVTEAKEDFHVSTMKLLQDKAGDAQDKDVKAGLESILKKFQDGNMVIGTEDIYKDLGKAFAEKDERKAYNLVVEVLNKVEPKLALAPLADPSAPKAQAATTAPKVDARTPA